jgi:hypothetical protein
MAESLEQEMSEGVRMEEVVDDFLVSPGLLSAADGQHCQNAGKK